MGTAAVAALFACALPASHAAWWRDDVFYEIYPRSFADSDGDGTGDLRGIIAHLDDLRALGVDDVWLTPIHPTPSEHGYDVIDYEAVAKDLGTLADVDALTKQAHARGMHVILDFVLNHTSVKHPWFKEHPERYVWRDKPDDRWRRPWDGAPVWHEKDGRAYLGLFWSGMPDLDLEDPGAVAAMLHAMRFWRAHGVDGFRIDAARYLIEDDPCARRAALHAAGPCTAAVQMADTPETHALLARLRHELGDDTLLVVEVWADDGVIAPYAHDVQLAFSFGTAGGLVDALEQEQRAPLVEALQAAEAAFPDRGFEAPFLTNHDMVRVMRDLAGDVSRARLGAAALMALPGTPFVYYGEEVGMQGAPPRHPHDDHSQRTALDWKEVARERAAPASLWHAYFDVIALRHAHPALTAGAARRPRTTGGGRGAFALLRDGAGERVLFVANFAGAATGPFDVDVAAGAPEAPHALLAEGLVAGGARVGPGVVHIDGLAAHGFAFLALAPR